MRTIIIAQVKLAEAVEAEGAVAVAKRTGTMPNTIRLLASGASDPHRSTIEKLAVLGITASDWFTPAAVTAPEPPASGAASESDVKAEPASQPDVGRYEPIVADLGTTF